jgi:hypothetical protein
MSNKSETSWYHSNQYTAQSACQFCNGIVRHEHWCATVDHFVEYAYRIVADPTQLTAGDALVLHSLGVRWS